MKDRPATKDNEDLLMDLIRDFQVYINQEEEKIKIIEAYDYFIRESQDRGCTYAKKCKNIFMTEMLKNIKTHIRKINKII